MAKKLKQPLITVIMPVYNGERFLEEAIVSILNQTYKKFEFFIINDGSTDKTSKIVAEYKKKDNRIKAINHKKNRGVIYSLNEGIKKSRGEYLARMDSDDISLPVRLSREIDYLIEHKDYILIGTQYSEIDEYGKHVVDHPLLLKNDEISIGLRYKSEFCHGSVLIRKKILMENNLYYGKNDLYFEDYPLWLKLLNYGKVANLDERLYLWRNVKRGITNSHLQEMVRGAEITKEIFIKSELPLDKKMIEKFEKDSIKSIHDFRRQRNTSDKINLVREYQFIAFCVHIELIKLHKYYQSLKVLLFAISLDIKNILGIFSWYGPGFVKILSI